MLSRSRKEVTAMPQSSLRLFKNAAVHWPSTEIRRIPDKTRGIYFLYEESADCYMNVVYVGIARGEATGIKGRLLKHKASKKGWTHFSAYEVWDNIGPKEIEELEAFFLAVYARDEHANPLNRIKGSSVLRELKRKTDSAGLLGLPGPGRRRLGVAKAPTSAP
jgi:hypothetical protein